MSLGRISAKLLMSALTVFLSGAALTGCGFSPMYGTHAPGASQSSPESRLDQVEIAAIKNREGVHLRNALIDRFYVNGYPASPGYRLEISKISEVRTNLDVTTSSEATRAQLTQRLDMKLYDLKKPDEPVLKRSLSNISSYNILESEFATRISQQKAREGGLDDLARQIELNLTLYFNRTP